MPAVAAIASLMSLVACGGGDLQSLSQANDVAILPASPLVAPGETVKLSTVVDGKPADAVKWSVEQADGGTIDDQGNYTAPGTEGTYTVDATTTGPKTAKVQVSVVKGIHVSVSPSTATVGAGGTLTFTASVSGNQKGVTWSVLEGSAGGSITSAGAYTAPNTAGTYHVVATSTADSTQSATAAITVTASQTPTPTPTPTPPPTNPAPSGVGTGATHTPQYITNVTGGGAMPDLTGAPVANCPGDGSTDVTSCLQNAINSAAAAHKPLLIPATSASYEISNRLQVTTSLIGTGGMPTIHTTNMNRNLQGDVLEVESNFSGWISNLHLVGNFNGTGDASGQWAHTIDLGCASNVTISGNLLEKAIGDAVSTDRCHNTGGQARNVLIANNTMKGMFRCGVAFIWNIDGVVVRDNLIDKQSDFVSGIDFEPEANGTVTHVEVLYNEFAMYNPVPYYATEGSDGKAVSGWQVSSNPGGNYYIHHNYGHYGTGFGGEFGGSNWGYVYVSNNAAGPMPQ